MPLVQPQPDRTGVGKVPSIDQAPTILQPQVDHLRGYMTHSLEGPRGGDATIEASWALYRAMEPLEPGSDTPGAQENRFIWLRAPRGEIDDWRTFDEWSRDRLCFEDDGDPTEEGWRQEWLGWYPDEYRWHVVSTHRDGEWLLIAIDGGVVMEVSPLGKEEWDDKNRASYLGRLARVAEWTVGAVRAGTYADFVNEGLSYDLRWGFIRRNVFWEVAGADARRFGGDMGRDEAEELARLLRAQKPEDEMPRLPELSIGRYFRALREAYIAAGMTLDRPSWRRWGDNDPREWYSLFGDDRDDSILTIDQESPGALRELFATGRNSFNHTFEVIAGRGCTRIVFAPHLEPDGAWSLSIHGCFTVHADRVARMWRRLNEIGMPTFLLKADALADLLLGEDWVVLAPRDESPDYMEGSTKFGREVGLAIPLWDEYRDELIARAEWMPPELPKLA